jgi:hypothetical protein
VAQLWVDAKTNELKAAVEMLAILPLKGRVITANAIQTHREICATVIEGAGTTSCLSRENDEDSPPQKATMIPGGDAQDSDSRGFFSAAPVARLTRWD